MGLGVGSQRVYILHQAVAPTLMRSRVRGPGKLTFSSGHRISPGRPHLGIPGLPGPLHRPWGAFLWRKGAIGEGLSQRPCCVPSLSCLCRWQRPPVPACPCPEPVLHSPSQRPFSGLALEVWPLSRCLSPSQSDPRVLPGLDLTHGTALLSLPLELVGLSSESLAPE